MLHLKVNTNYIITSLHYIITSLHYIDIKLIFCFYFPQFSFVKNVIKTLFKILIIIYQIGYVIFHASNHCAQRHRFAMPRCCCNWHSAVRVFFGVVAVACLVASSTSLHLDLGLVVAVVK